METLCRFTLFYTYWLVEILCRSTFFTHIAFFDMSTRTELETSFLSFNPLGMDLNIFFFFYTNKQLNKKCVSSHI